MLFGSRKNACCVCVARRWKLGLGDRQVTAAGDVIFQRKSFSYNEGRSINTRKLQNGVQISDDSISGFQFRYDIDTILTKYRDIDTISHFVNV